MKADKLHVTQLLHIRGNYDCAKRQRVSFCHFLILVISIHFFRVCNWILHTMKQDEVRDRALIKVLTKGFGDSNIRQGASPRHPLKVIKLE